MDTRYFDDLQVGDIIRTELSTLEKKEPRADRGVVIVGHTVKNRNDQGVPRFTTTRLMKRRPAAGG